MGAISLDEYKKRREAVKQEVARPNTILFSDYNAKYGNQKLPTEVTRAGNSFLLPTIEQPKVQKQEEQYIDTGKTYGDYLYQDYAKRKDDKIYSKGGKYYVLNGRTGEYDYIDALANTISTPEANEKMLEEAKALGYKGNQSDLAHISNKILLDTGNLTKKEYADYSKDLKRQEEKLDKEQAEKTKIRYSGTGIDALKQIGTKASDVAYTADKEIIAPIKNAKENYNIGKKNNELAIEYYKKMEGKKNNAKELEEKQQKFNRYNQDLITNPGAAGSAIQNMDTQVQSALKSGKAAIPFGIGGAIVGGIAGTTAGGVGAIPGAIAGAKAGAAFGYTIGGTPYTYKLEAGNQYKDLIEQGIPEKIAKDLSRKTGLINAAIESGEKVLDIITWGKAGKLKNAAEQELYNQLKKEYGEKALKTLLVKTGYSYAQNILSESAEEMAQEGTSIHYEKEAFKKAGLDRQVTSEEDLNRVLEAGKSAAISTAFTAPLTSAGGAIVDTTLNNLQTVAAQKVNTLTNTEINTEIKNQILNANQENNANLTTEEILTIQQQVKNDLNGKNITIIDDTNTQTKEQIQNRIASLKEDLQTYETFTNEATRTESETREINNIKQEIKNLQQELRQQNNIPTVQDLVNQQKNQQVTKTNNLNEYIADVAAREAIQNETNRQSVRESILSYLDENKITNPTKEDMMNAMDWYEGFDASENLTEINKAEKLYSEVADELLSEKNNTLTTQNNQEIQGMKATKSQVEDAVYSKFDQMSSEYGFDVDEVEGVYLHGSRLRGTANQNSDLDAVVFYIGNESEDYIFNTINDDNNQLVIDGVKVDINPVSIDSLSEIDDYIAKSEAYDNQIINSTKNQTVNEVNLKDSNIPINQDLVNETQDTLNENLERYTNKETKNIESEKITIAQTDSDIMDFVDNAIKSKSSNKVIYFGKISNDLATKIYNVTGIDVKEYNLSLKADNVKKILKDHGNPVTEAARGQLAVVKNDFKFVDDVILENDSFYYSGETNQGKPSITFVKNLDNKYTIVEYVSDKHHNLEVQTMWKSKKKNSVTVLHDNNPGLNTSKTDSDTSSFYDNNIPQINEKVKLLPTNNDMQNVENNTKNSLLSSNEDANLKSLEATAPIVEQEQIAPIKKITNDPTKESSYDDADLPNFWELNKEKKSNLDNEIDEFKRAIDRQLQEETITPKEIKRNNSLKSQLSEMYSNFQEQFINRNYEIDKYSKLTGNKEIMFKGDMLNNVAGEVTGDINIGQTDNYGRQIGESLSSLFKNAKKKGYYDQFDDYLKHYSNIDRHAYGKGSVVPLEYSQKMVKAYETSIPGIKNEATKVWQYGKNMLNNMEENGLISKNFKATLEEMYPHYVPYMQSDSMIPYMDDSGEIKPKKVIKRAEGKAHDLITVEEALEKYTYAHKKAIRQNDLYKEIVKTSKEKIAIGADDRIDPTQLNNSLGHDMEGNGYLTAYIDGDMQQAKISDKLYQELAKTNELRLKDAESKYAPILKPIQKISEIRRNILTSWNLSFLITNSTKDIQDGLLNSKYTTDMVKNYPGAFYELATQNTEMARQFSSLYGSGMVMGEYQIDRLTNATKNMDIKQVNKIMQAIPNLNEIIELTPRYAEFKASLEHGTSVTEAMYNAREVTTNFGRGGYITKALNRNGFTFLNASVQGFDKMIRNFTGANGSKGIAVSVTGTLMKVVALGVAPALFNATAFGAGDDDEDEAYKALPNYIKDNYYLFKVKGLGNKTSKYYDGTFLRIPKGRVLSVFGSAARRTLEFTKGDKNAFDGYLKNVDSQIGINNPEENNIFAPIKQAFGSKNGEAWYGGDIIPKRLQNKPVAEQYDESTDEFSKWLGKTLNISPYKINYLVDQYSGGVGDIVLPMITKETTNGATTVPDYLLAPLKDKFIVNSTDDNKYASNFYSSLEKAQTKANGEKSKVEDKLKYKYMSSISSDMSKLYKEKREIQLDDSLTKKQKYKKVQNVQKEINRLAEEGIKDYKVKDLKSNYGKIANKEYYKNNKNEWSVIKDEESADLNSMRMTSNEKNNYFIAKNKISNIKQQDIDSKIKKSKISDIVLKTNLSDEKMAYLYGKYYSKEETLDIIQDAGISIKEFIKFDSQDIESDYYANGKAVPNSKKKKTIAYINSLNLSAIQKAMLIRMEYSSFTSYDRQIIQYVNNQKLNSEDKKAIYEKLGFKIRNGRVYSK